ncbi:MAG: hypothetical protein VX346_16970 [Planctomycetota bacterium]|nr:hypothetical protein [Planctomycetota bacterium]
MMALASTVYVLVLLDSAFSGVCAASGRNALIRKRGYYLRSMWHGALWGHAAILIGLLLVTMAVLFSTNRTQAFEEARIAGWRMATVYSWYAIVVMSTFLIRAYPSVDIRSITSTVGFGPLTLIRPVVILLGIAYAAFSKPDTLILLVAIVIGLMMIPFRVFLNVVFVRMSAYGDPCVSRQDADTNP